MRVLLAVALIVLGLALVSSWTGVGPIGSDNDEYREVAKSLLAGDGLVVGGGVEATKYPIGYPALLAAFEVVGLPVTGTALVVNVLAVLLTVALLAALALRADAYGPMARRRDLWLPAIAVVIFVGTNPGLWDMVGSTMPDALATALTCAVILAAATRPSGRRTALLVVLPIVAVLLKSLAVLLVPLALVALALDRRQGGQRWRAWAAAPAAGALAVVAGGALAVAGLPEHTTGYARTFLLRNPGDAALGEAGLGDVIARLWTRLDIVFEIGAKAVIGPRAAPLWAIPVTVVLVVAAIVGLRRLRWALAIYCLAYVGLLALWPYQSVRLSSPILPVAALGVGVLVHSTATVGPQTMRRAATSVGLIAVILLGVVNLDMIRTNTDRAEARTVQLEQDLLVAIGFLDERAAPGTVVSFDYREVAYRLEQPVLPLGYTSDIEVLHAASVGAGAQWLVVVDAIAPSRPALAGRLIRQYREDFTLALDTPTVQVWQIITPS